MVYGLGRRTGAPRQGLTNKINYRVGYATSPDGVVWTKRPGNAGAGSVLGLGEPGTPDSKSAGQPWVLKDGSAYHMWYEGFDGKTWRIFYAESTDGMTWTKRGAAFEPAGRELSMSSGARNPVVVKRGGQYELWYQGRSASPNRAGTSCARQVSRRLVDQAPRRDRFAGRDSAWAGRGVVCGQRDRRAGWLLPSLLRSREHDDARNCAQHSAEQAMGDVHGGSQAMRPIWNLESGIGK